MKYDNQFFLDFVEKMPAEQKGCRVNTNEDGTGNVDLGDFIVHYGKALVEYIQNESKPKRTKKKPKVEDDCGK